MWSFKSPSLQQNRAKLSEVTSSDAAPPPFNRRDHTSLEDFKRHAIELKPIYLYMYLRLL